MRLCAKHKQIVIESQRPNNIFQQNKKEIQVVFIESKMNKSSQQKSFDVSEAYTIDGIHTEILLHKFVNKYLLIITQYEKLNNVFVACNDIALSGIVQNRSLNIKHQFGMTSDEIECGIRFLLNNIKLPNFDRDLDVVVCLGLKEYNGKILKQVTGVLNQLETKNHPNHPTALNTC